MSMPTAAPSVQNQTDAEANVSRTAAAQNAHIQTAAASNMPTAAVSTPMSNTGRGKCSHVNCRQRKNKPSARAIFVIYAHFYFVLWNYVHFYFYFWLRKVNLDAFSVELMPGEWRTSLMQIQQCFFLFCFEFFWFFFRWKENFDTFLYQWN